MFLLDRFFMSVEHLIILYILLLDVEVDYNTVSDVIFMSPAISF